MANHSFQALMQYDNYATQNFSALNKAKIGEQEGSELSGGQDTMVFGKMIPTRT